MVTITETYKLVETDYFTIVNKNFVSRMYPNTRPKYETLRTRAPSV